MIKLKAIWSTCFLLVICSNAFALPIVNISAMDSSAAEAGQDPGSFTVTRTDDGSLGQALNVNFDFIAPPTGTDFDFSAGLGYIDGNSRIVTIAANQSSATVTITPRLDNLIEGTEALQISLVSSSAYTLGNPNEASIEIADDVAQVHISAIDPAMAEAGQDPGSFTVTRSDNGNKTVSLSVYFDFVAPPTGTDFDFSAGLGYIDGNSRIVTIAANQSSATVTITPRLDNLIEGTEALQISLVSTNTHTLGSPKEASFEITDDVAQVHISAIDPAMAEAGQDPGSFTVTRSDNGNKTVSLSVYFDFVAPPTGTDFDFSAGLGYIDGNTRIVTIAANQSSATVTITPRLDNLIEGTEALQISLVSTNTHTLGSPKEASFEITDDVAQVHISAIDPAMAEAGQDPGSFTVTRSDNGNKTVSLSVYFDFVAPPTGTDFDFSAGLGYIDADSRIITIAAGQSSATVTITPRLDNLIEGTETLEITLVSTNTHTLGSPNEASFEITDDVAQVHISAIDPAMAEAGQDPGSFTVTRSDNGNKTVSLSVHFDFVAPPTGTDFDFSAGLGYIDADSRIITIAAGQSSATVTITPRLDNLIEGTEALQISLVSTNTHTLGSPNEASFEITDDVAQVHISAIDPAAAEAGQDPGSFTVTRSDNGNKTVSLSVYFDFVAPPTGTDFDFSAGLGYIDADSRIITIAAGQSSATVTITPRLDSNEEEGDEIVMFQLVSNNTYTLGIPNQANITITDFTNVVFKNGFEDTP